MLAFSMWGGVGFPLFNLSVVGILALLLDLSIMLFPTELHYSKWL